MTYQITLYTWEVVMDSCMVRRLNVDSAKALLRREGIECSAAFLAPHQGFPKGAYYFCGLVLTGQDAANKRAHLVAWLLPLAERTPILLN